MRDVTINRLFFAIRPPSAIARRIARDMAWLDAQMLDHARLHLTMLILDDCSELDPHIVAAMIAIGGAVRASPIGIMLDRMVASHRSIALRPAVANAGLTAVHAQLRRLAGSVGIVERNGYRFGAHMTVGYRAGMPSSHSIAPIDWMADELVLVHSHVGRTRHDVLGCWSLTAAPDPQLSLF